MRTVRTPGRWIWGVSGLVTAVVLAVPSYWLIVLGGKPTQSQPLDTVTRTVTVTQPVTSLNVQSYGSPVQVTGSPGRRAQITETITYNPQDGGPPAVTPTVSGGRLTLADPACNVSGCGIGLAITVPPDVAVTAATEGGPVAISGIAGGHVDSSGGWVLATGIHGPLTVVTQGGTLQLNGLTGPLYADTGGGRLWAQGVTATTATVSTGGGDAQIQFTAAPDTVLVSTDGGPARLTVPGGPYALTADSDGSPQLVGIATDPAARRSITVTTGGAALQIVPPGRGSPQVRPPAPVLPQFPPAPVLPQIQAAVGL